MIITQVAITSTNMATKGEREVAFFLKGDPGKEF